MPFWHHTSPRVGMGTSARASALAYCALSVFGSLLSAKTAEWVPRSSPILALQAACASAWFVWRRRRRTSLASLVRGVARVFPLALAFSAALWTRMEANRHLTQSTIVVARHVIPLVTLPLERVVLGRPIRPSVVAPLASVALGAALYADALRARFSPAGHAALLAHVLVTALQLIAAERASAADHPDDFAARVNLAMTPVFLVGAARERGPERGPSRSGSVRAAFAEFAATIRELPPARRWTVLATVPSATALSWAQARAQRNVSATTIAACNNAAKWIHIAAATTAFGEPAPKGTRQWLGIALTFVGGMAYARASTRGNEVDRGDGRTKTE